MVYLSTLVELLLHVHETLFCSFVVTQTSGDACLDSPQFYRVNGAGVLCVEGSHCKELFSRFLEVTELDTKQQDVVQGDKTELAIPDLVFHRERQSSGQDDERLLRISTPARVDPSADQDPSGFGRVALSHIESKGKIESSESRLELPLM